MYRWMKVAAVIQGVVLAIVLSVVGVALGTNFIGLYAFFIPVVAVVLGVWSGWYGWRQVRIYETQNYDWYRGHFPELVSANRVLCYRCKGAQIRVRGLMNHTYTREHVCGHCGTRLYYSPEK